MQKENSIEELAKLVLSSMSSMLNKKVESVVSINPEKEGGWKFVVEVLERQAIPNSMDLVGRYEVKTNQNGEILNFKQVLLRHRNDATRLED